MLILASATITECQIIYALLYCSVPILQNSFSGCFHCIYWFSVIYTNIWFRICSIFHHVLVKLWCYFYTAGTSFVVCSPYFSLPKRISPELNLWYHQGTAIILWGDLEAMLLYKLWIIGKARTKMLHKFDPQCS